jgi:hypothetical protein
VTLVETTGIITINYLIIYIKLEYLDVTVFRRGVGEVQVVAGRAPAC